MNSPEMGFWGDSRSTQCGVFAINRTLSSHSRPHDCMSHHNRPHDIIPHHIAAHRITTTDTPRRDKEPPTIKTPPNRTAEGWCAQKIRFGSRSLDGDEASVGARILYRSVIVGEASAPRPAREDII